MTMPKIKLIFINSQNQQHDLDFLLIESHIAHRWFKKLRHIHRIPISDTDSRLSLIPDKNKYDIEIIHEEFCRLAKINFNCLDYEDQTNLNLLHELYEQYHDRLVESNADCLYRFHQAIHNIEFVRRVDKFNSLSFGWGEKEGPLMEKMNMHEHYSDILKNGNLYVKWSELGKLPFQYFMDGEPNDQARFNVLSKPNNTLRPKFSLQISINNFQFTNEFDIWFKNYKTGWFLHHGINGWRPIDEMGGVHVAEPLQDVDLEEFISTYPNCEKIELSL